MLQVKALGRFAVLNGTCPLLIPGVRDRALLAYLAITGTSQSRQKLASLIWPSRGEEQARQSLRQSLTTLRKMGIPILSDGRERVGLGSGIACDTQAFVAHCQSGVWASLRSAVEIYEGELLADWPADLEEFEQWLVPQRAHFSAIAVQLLMRLLNWSAPRPEPADQLFLARKALAVDPYLEAAHREEMLALIRMGLRSEALVAHQDFSGLLLKDLGIAPDELTCEVAARARVSPAAANSDEPAQRTPKLRPRLAVFPLRVEAGSEELHYLARGIMSEIATVLSLFPGIQVIAPQSSFRLADDEDRLEIAARSLRATFVAEGTLSATGDVLLVKFELIDLSSGSIVMTELRQGTAIDYPALMQHLAHAIANKIDNRITHLRRSLFEATEPERLAAWDIWVRGQFITEQWTAAVESQAEALFRKAIAADPTLARAHSSLAMLYNGRILVMPGLANESELRMLALDHARRAIELDPVDPRSHLAMAWVSIFLCDLHRAKRHAQLAYESNPHSADALIHVGLLKAYLGDAASGLRLAGEAFDLNPLFPDWYLYMKSQIHILAGQPHEALEIASGIAGRFLELPGWLVVAAAEIDDDAVMHQMASLFLTQTSESWSGTVQWSPLLSVEWFLSVNRWLADRDRELLVRGLKKAGLL